MTEEQFIQLLQGFYDRRLSEEELLSFLKATEDPRFESLVGEKLYAELAQLKAMPITDEERANKVWQNIYASINGKEEVPAIPAVQRVHFLKTAWFRYAAAIIILLGIGGYFWMTSKEKQLPPQVEIADIAPGKKGAILTLADGTKLNLDSMGNGLVAEQNGTKVLLNNGSLDYNAGNASAVTFNTMTTPNGRQFSIQLPDGSKAWLNAASSITYPTAFIGQERPVSITGEVYFEVVKDAKRPFKVKVNDKTEIEVLGTSFNVKAYAGDASINTTLLEGRVKTSIVKGEKSNLKPETVILKPGQQAIVHVSRLPSADSRFTIHDNADIPKIMAWKNGLFNFQDESLEEVMKQLERWYDIKVKYMGNPPRQQFFGEIGRDLTLSQVIESLREVGIQFTIEGRTLIVKP